MRRFAIPAIAVVVAAALLALLGVRRRAPGDATRRSTPRWRVATTRWRRTPATQLPILGSSGTESLADLRGKVVVLNVFASWCQPCVAEAPILEQEQRQLVKDDATILGVTYLDNSSDSEQFVRQHGITYPVVRDVSGNFVKAFGTTAFPRRS